MKGIQTSPPAQIFERKFRNAVCFYCGHGGEEPETSTQLPLRFSPSLCPTNPFSKSILKGSYSGNLVLTFHNGGGLVTRPPS